MSSEAVHQIVETIEDEVNSRPSAVEFEMAYQARVAIDRIRFELGTPIISPRARIKCVKPACSCSMPYSGWKR